MPEIPVPFPLGGINETTSHESQPTGTSVDASNVRSFDGATGRARGAQREGMARLSDDRLSANGKVQAITTVTYDGRQTLYSEKQTATAGDLKDWELSVGTVKSVALDNRGDVFVVEGNARLVKYNASGVKQYEVTLPVPTATQSVRAMHISELGDVYVACSEGSTGQHLCWIRSYYTDPDTNLALRWSMTVGGFVQAMMIRDEKLYAAINYPDSGKAKIVAYELIYTSIPVVSREWYVPYPVNDFSFNEKGEFITAHEERDNRSYDPRSPGITHVVDPSAMRWNPTMLPQWEERRWCWFDASQIPTQAGSEAIQDGDDIEFWEDTSGLSQVILQPSTVSGDKAPKFLKSGIAGRSAVRFEGADYRLETQGSIGSAASQDDAQKTLAPGTKGYLMVIVARLGQDYSAPGCLFYQNNYWWPSEATLDDYFCWPQTSSNNPAARANQRLDHGIFANCEYLQRTANWGYTTDPAVVDPDGFDNSVYGVTLYNNDALTCNANAGGYAAGTTYYVQGKYNYQGFGRVVTLSTSPWVTGEVGSGTYGTIPGGPSHGTNVSFTWKDYTTKSYLFGNVIISAESHRNRSPLNTTHYPLQQMGYARNSFGKSDNLSGMSIITVLRDNDDCDSEYSYSQFRVNGVPLAQWHGLKFTTPVNQKSVIGKVKTSDANDPSSTIDVGCLGLDADIYEIFVVRRYTDDEDGKKKVCTFPIYNANATGTNPSYQSDSDTEIERIEGYFAWKYGLSHLLDDGGGVPDSLPVWTNGIGESEYAHPFGLSTVTGCVQQPPNVAGKDDDSIDKVLWTSENPIMAKWNFQRGTTWALSPSGGVGYCVKTDGKSVWSIGRKNADGAAVVLWEDAGRTAEQVASAVVYSNQTSLPTEYSYKHPIASLDQYGQFWVPSAWDDELRHSSVRVFKEPTSGTVLQERIVYATDAITEKDCYAAVVDTTVRDYLDNPNTITLPEYFVLGTSDAGLDDTVTVQYCDPVQGVVDPNAKARNVVWLGISGGEIKTFTGGNVQTVVVEGAQLSADARLVQAVTAYQKVYITDGASYKVYDPKTNTAKDWRAGKSGRIPERCRLMTFWRGRMVLARGPNDPFNWHMSASGDPDDWDLFPPDGPLETQAISGNNSEIGGNHDIINALIPYDRERLIFGGDHSIHLMWGDPMAGGVITMLSDATGIAYGSGYAKDSQGILYFFGSRGGVYAMSPGGAADRISNHPQKISSQSIDRRLEKVNFDTHYVGMAWDDINQHLHVYQMPFGEHTEKMEHWCWEKRTNSWWIDTFADLDLEPTSVFLMDGDEPEDRIIAVGCQDGYVRYPNRTATSDDGYAIDSYVTIGPFYSGTDQIRLRNPKFALSKDQGGCWLELSVSDSADSVGEVAHRVRLNPGQNNRSMVGVRGAYCWLTLRSAANGHRWAYESGAVNIQPSGRRIAP